MECQTGGTYEYDEQREGKRQRAGELNIKTKDKAKGKFNRY